ncbi:hypothetical protein [Rufibacter latericius]|uniref:Uncharacterized protein n=1 Tax=Rufibacter latericius TaxID=2487040 RepID=A0A3M9MJ61_9BACT|nr:hypothetical protein [Rufibacter latericius]RNI25599.1 hypothetical protein EFB08_12080 [Rufibacter latericius]
MEYFYNLKSRAVLTFLLKVFFVLLVLNLLVLSLEFYLENYTSSNLASRYTFKNYVTGMFYFDGEKNIPTYFSTGNFLFSAALLFLISKHVRLGPEPLYHRKWFWLGWLFVWLAIDELFALHEITAKPMRTVLQQLFGQDNLGLLHFAWFVPYGLAILLVGSYFVKFAFSLPKKTLYNFLVSGFIFLAGAVGMEMVSGLIVSSNLMSVYKLVTTLEESLEFIGSIYFIYSLIKYMEGQKSLTNVRLNVSINTPKEREETPTEAITKFSGPKGKKVTSGKAL